MQGLLEHAPAHAHGQLPGWHDEALLVFNLTLATGVVPHNQDGGVQEFLCLSPGEVLRRVQLGEFTADAAASLARGLGLL